MVLQQLLQLWMRVGTTVRRLNRGWVCSCCRDDLLGNPTIHQWQSIICWLYARLCLASGRAATHADMCVDNHARMLVFCSAL